VQSRDAQDAPDGQLRVEPFELRVDLQGPTRPVRDPGPVAEQLPDRRVDLECGLATVEPPVEMEAGRLRQLRGTAQLPPAEIRAVEGRPVRLGAQQRVDLLETIEGDFIELVGGDATKSTSLAWKSSRAIEPTR
jgi:hypothetical protein